MPEIILSFVAVFSLQFFLCTKVRSKKLHFLPICVLFVSSCFLSLAAYFARDWDALAYIVFAMICGYFYSNMIADLEARAGQTSQFFASYIGQNYDDYYQSCVAYVQSFDMSTSMELQFINADGLLVASSYGNWATKSPTTSEIQDAMQSKRIRHFFGIEPDTGETIIAVSGPMIYMGGEVVGVLRYVTSTRLVNLQILSIALISIGAFLVLLAVMLLSSNYYIRSIVLPVDEITEKAKKIANGSYGVQIQKKYNDEIGVLADTINEMSNKINQNEKMQAEFISSLSHELRTPLTAINGWSETLLNSDDLDKETRRGVRIISKEAKRLTEMVVDLLDFTRLQDNRLNLNIEMADIQAVYSPLCSVLLGSVICS